MVNQELVKQLLKEFESEKGCPVQIRVDTPESVQYASGTEHLGAFGDREAVVQKVKDLDLEYVQDVLLIEGNYASLNDLRQKIKDYNILFSRPTEGSRAKEAFDLVQEQTGSQLFRNSLASNFGKEIDKNETLKILEVNGFPYFQHNIVAKPNGVYDDRTSPGGTPIVDETKIADISLKLI